MFRINTRKDFNTEFAEFAEMSAPRFTNDPYVPGWSSD
jgi:hypothetical protein